MNIPEVIQYLADNYKVGIPVLCGVVVLGYLVFSIRLIVTSRREGLNVCMSAMIPAVNLFIWMRKGLRKHKNNKIRRERLSEEKNLSEGGEIEL